MAFASVTHVFHTVTRIKSAWITHVKMVERVLTSSRVNRRERSACVHLVWPARTVSFHSTVKQSARNCAVTRNFASNSKGVIDVNVSFQMLAMDVKIVRIQIDDLMPVYVMHLKNEKMAKLNEACKFGFSKQSQLFIAIVLIFIFIFTMIGFISGHRLIIQYKKLVHIL